MKYYRSLVLGFLAVFVFGLFSAPAAYALAGDSESNDNGQERRSVLVSFSEHPGAAERNQIRGLGGEVTSSYENFPVFAVTLPEQAITALSNNPQVERVEKNYPAWAVAYDGNNEIENAWGLAHTGADQTIADGDRGEAVKVAVVDSGVDYTHPNLEANFGDTLGYDTFGGDSPMDGYGHGTHVAGTVGATLDGLGVAGVAPDVQLYGVRVLDDDGYGSHESIAGGLDWIISYNETADEPIRITNNSYGSGGGTTVLQDAFNQLDEQGVINIAAAGNSGNPGGNNDTVIYPAKYSTVMAVSAVDSNNQRPNWSSSGGDVEITAPGVSVLSTWIDSVSYADPQPIVLTNDVGESARYKEGSGTSMSSPHVAGAAAVALGIDPNLTPEEVRAILNDTAEDIGLSARQQGNGLLRVDRVAAEVQSRTPVATGSLTGVVTDGQNPIAEASITIDGLGDITDENGAYSISDVPVGEHQVRVSAEGYNAATADVEITENQDTERDFTLDEIPAYALSGSISDEDAQPIAGAEVTILGTGLSTASDSNGSYNFAEVTEGTYTVEVRADGFEVAQKDISLTEDTTALNFTLTAEAVGASVTVSELTIEGRGGRLNDRHIDITAVVVDDNGVAISDATVALTLTNGSDNWSFSGTTDSSGEVSFTMTNAPSGCFTAEIEDVIADGLTWDEAATPSHEEFCK